MQTLRHILPSTGALAVFEAAGRHLSFTAAQRVRDWLIANG